MSSFRLAMICLWRHRVYFNSADIDFLEPDHYLKCRMFDKGIFNSFSHKKLDNISLNDRINRSFIPKSYPNAKNKLC